MNTIRSQPRRLFALGAITAVLFAGCATTVRTPPPPRVVVREMPAPIVEIAPAAPGPSFNWVPGHWIWRDGNWRWTSGRYVQAVVPEMPPLIVEQIPLAPSPTHAWVRGHWRWTGTHWAWVQGTWVF
jgi:WXXGXW repeat (2 copies)